MCVVTTSFEFPELLPSPSTLLGINALCFSYSTEGLLKDKEGWSVLF